MKYFFYLIFILSLFSCASSSLDNNELKISMRNRNEIFINNCKDVFENLRYANQDHTIFRHKNYYAISGISKESNTEGIKYDGFYMNISDTAILIKSIEPFGIYNAIYFLEHLLDKGLDYNIDTVRNPYFKERSGGVFDNWAGPQHFPKKYSKYGYARWLSKHSINYHGLHDASANLPDSIAAIFDINLYSGGGANLFYDMWRPDESDSLIADWLVSNPGAFAKTEPNPHTGKQWPVLCIQSVFGKQKHREKFTEMLEPSKVNRLLFTFGDWSGVCGSECPRCGKWPTWKRISIWLEIASEQVKEIKPEAKVIGRTWYYTAQDIDSIIRYTATGVGIRQKEPAGIVLDNPEGYTLIQDNYSDVINYKKELSDLYGPIYLSGGKLRGEDFYAATGIGDTDEAIDPVIGFQTPYITAYKIRRLAENDIKNLSVWWGGLHAFVYSVNHEIIHEMIWDPFQDIDAMVERLAARDFGELSKETVELWKMIDTAMNEWKYINWQQQFEEFVSRSDNLIFTPLFPNKIKNNKWVKWMTPNKKYLLENENQVLVILDNAVKKAEKIYESAKINEIKLRAKQQYYWLKLFTHIFHAQNNVLKAIDLMENNGTKKQWDLLWSSDKKNTRGLILTIQSIDLENFKFSNRIATETKNIDLLEKKVDMYEKTIDKLK